MESHDGSVSKPVPNVFGMNFQAVSVGQKLIEMSVSMTGGYLDGDGTPTPALSKSNSSMRRSASS